MAGDPADDQSANLLSSLVETMAALDSGSSSTPETPAPAVEMTPRQLHVAAAVLLLQMIRADAEVRQDEHRGLARALRRVLDLSDEESNLVVRLAEDEVRSDVSLPRVLGLLDRHCSVDLKRKIVHCLWRIAYADAELRAHEEYFARKIAEHLNLSTADIVETKVRAREEFFAEEL
jgi:uncharacterized tellurite resistance protein B-like protein